MKDQLNEDGLAKHARLEKLIAPLLVEFAKELGHEKGSSDGEGWKEAATARKRIEDALHWAKRSVAVQKRHLVESEKDSKKLAP